MNRNKYLIVHCSEIDGKVKEYHQFKTRNDIKKKYNIPLYIIDKMISLNNDVDFRSKRDFQKIFQHLIKTVKIYLIRPSYD